MSQSQRIAPRRAIVATELRTDAATAFDPDAVTQQETSVRQSGEVSIDLISFGNRNGFAPSLAVVPTADQLHAVDPRRSEPAFAAQWENVSFVMTLANHGAEFPRRAVVVAANVPGSPARGAKRFRGIFKLSLVATAVQRAVIADPDIAKRNVLRPLRIDLSRESLGTLLPGPAAVLRPHDPGSEYGITKRCLLQAFRLFDVRPAGTENNEITVFRQAGGMIHSDRLGIVPRDNATFLPCQTVATGPAFDIASLRTVRWLVVENREDLPVLG